MKKNLTAPLAFALIFSAGTANADTITSLFNTGVDNFGIALSNGSVDSHYKIVTDPGVAGTVSELAYGYKSGWPIAGNGPWQSPGSNAGWDTPTSTLNTSTIAAAGLWDYRTSFSLAGLNPATADITGSWTADNIGVEILLNGVNTGIPATPDSTFQLVNFAINSGFVAGLNTLDFIVNNVSSPYSNNPSGLLVELSGTAASSAVPLPSAIWTFMAGTMALLALGKRRKAASLNHQHNG